MDVGRFVILDADGNYMNTILVNTPYPECYTPGYGRYVVYAGNDPAPAAPANNDMATGLTYLTVRPSMSMSMGSKMDITTGTVTPPPFVEGADAGTVDGGSAFVEGLA